MAMMTSDIQTRKARRPSRRPSSLPYPQIQDFGVSLLIDDGSPLLAQSGYLIYPEVDRYLVRIWHLLTFYQLANLYRRHLQGEPLELLLRAFELRSLDEIPADGSGDWGSGDMLVNQECVIPRERRGLLIPHDRRAPSIG